MTHTLTNLSSHLFIKKIGNCTNGEENYPVCILMRSNFTHSNQCQQKFNYPLKFTLLLILQWNLQFKKNAYKTVESLVQKSMYSILGEIAHKHLHKNILTVQGTLNIRLEKCSKFRNNWIDEWKNEKWRETKSDIFVQP